MRKMKTALFAIGLLISGSAASGPGKAAGLIDLARAPAKSFVAPSPSDVLAQAPASAWKDIPASDLIVWKLKDGHSAVLWLAEAFAPVHVANIRLMTRAHYFDTAAISRVQDNYVVQWGREEGAHLPDGIIAHPPEEYDWRTTSNGFTALPYRDAYAPIVGFVKGWPVAHNNGVEWLTHCYGMVGAGRDLAPDTGTGAELYAVLGHAPRHLDRNITVVGRMIDGMEFLTDHPRGTEALGFYRTMNERISFESVTLVSDLPQAQQPHYQVLDTGAKAFADWIRARANRGGPFFVKAAGAVDLCNAMPPVRLKP